MKVRFGRRHRFLLIAVAALVLIAGIVAGTIRSMHKHRLDDALKRELVDRGISAEEIEWIVKARKGTGGK